MLGHLSGLLQGVRHAALEGADTLTVGLVPVEGVHHAAARPCEVAEPHLARAVQRTLSELVELECCDRCVPRLAGFSNGRTTSPLGHAAALVQGEQVAAAALRAATSASSPQAASKKASRSRDSVRSCAQNLRAIQESSDAFATETDRVLSLLHRAEAALESFTVSDHHRNTVKRQVRSWRVPKDHPDLLLDEGTTLLGVAHAGSHTRGGQDVIDAFGLLDEPGRTVLLAPRFVVEWFVLDLASTVLRWPLFQTLPLEDEAVAETAARLWEPGSSGAMADLLKAVEAARRV